jgi:hypothetical protein
MKGGENFMKKFQKIAEYAGLAIMAAAGAVIGQLITNREIDDRVQEAISNQNSEVEEQ